MPNGTVEGTSGDDFIVSGYVDADGDSIDGADGVDDIIVAGAGNDIAIGDAGNDSIYGGAGDDQLKGVAGDDVLYGGAGANDLFGGAGQDIFVGGVGADTFSGGKGQDNLDYSGSTSGVNIDLSAGTLTGGDAENDTISSGIDGVIGTDFDDVMVGFHAQGTDPSDIYTNEFYGGAGNDSISALGGDDVLEGGTGDDFLDGGAGDDMITGGDGSDSVLGGAGNDVIDTSGPVSALGGLPDRGYPGLFPADTDITNDLDTVDGGDGNDTIRTGDDNDSILGGAGDDTIDGGVDDDIIDGGTGNDFIVGGEGADIIDGGAGDDVIYGGLDPSFPDIFNIPDATDLRPDNGLDTIHGGDGNDTIFGEDDDDELYGDAGNDVIDGGIDDDTIFGGADDDQITGGEGADVMSGGDGRDTFIIGSAADGDGDSADGGTGGVDFDTLDLTGAGDFRIVGQTVDADGDSTSGTVEFLNAPGGTVIGSMAFTEIESIVPCFTPGTLIATMRGEKRVEQLQVGDKIITRDNGAQEIRWIGFKPMSGVALQSAPDLQPILIRQGALGKGLPERDILVSPNHRLLVNNPEVNLYFNQNEVLVPAKHLLESGVGVQTICQTGTIYIHFMFDNHEVVLSDGTWTESFQPGDLALNGIADEQRGEIFTLFPELELAEGREAYSAARQSLKKHEARLLFK